MTGEPKPDSSDISELQSRLFGLGIECAPDDLPEVARHLEVLERMVEQLEFLPSGSKA